MYKITVPLMLETVNDTTRQEFLEQLQEAKADRITLSVNFVGASEEHTHYEHFPHLWAQLQRWDESTWRQFRADYSVRDLAVRFEFEKEWIGQGKSIKSRAFHTALKERIKDSKKTA